jgi:hypothetical protein
MSKLNENIPNEEEFIRVVRRLLATGISDDEIGETIVRDYPHLVELTDEEIAQAHRAAKEQIILTANAQLNRESIAENGHPFVVSERIDGVLWHRSYDSLDTEQIADYRRRGIIL